MSDEVRDPKTNQLIYPGFQRGPGLHNASSYQVSAIPFLTGNLSAPPANVAITAVINFPSVTSWFKIDNLSKIKKGNANKDFKLETVTYTSKNPH